MRHTTGHLGRPIDLPLFGDALPEEPSLPPRGSAPGGPPDFASAVRVRADELLAAVRALESDWQSAEAEFDRVGAAAERLGALQLALTLALERGPDPEQAAELASARHTVNSALFVILELIDRLR